MVCFSETGLRGGDAAPSAVLNPCSARSQSCSGEPCGQPRSAQYFSAKAAIWSCVGRTCVGRIGAATAFGFLAAGFRFLAVPLDASPLLVVIHYLLRSLVIKIAHHKNGHIPMIR